MDEARRFLRYVVPGLSFAVQTTLLLWVLIPIWAQKMIAVLSSDKGIGIAIAAILGSGGVGFVFSVFHHELLWEPNRQWLTGPIDYRDLIERLRGRNFICLLDAQSGEAIPANRKPDRFEAWAIVTSLWHERIVTNKKTNRQIKSADPRADSLINLVHSMGTARIASFFAVILAIVIAGYVSEYSSEKLDVVRFFFAIATAVVLLYLHQSGYMRTGLLAQRVVEQVLTDSLADEAFCVPVKTNVVLKTHCAVPPKRGLWGQN